MAEKSKSEHFKGLSGLYVQIFYKQMDIDKLKYEKLSKYRFKQPKCIVLGTPKKPKEMPRVRVDFAKQKPNFRINFA